MMMASLAGFAVSVDGLKSVIHCIFRICPCGFNHFSLFLITASSVLFVSIQVNVGGSRKSGYPTPRYS